MEIKKLRCTRCENTLSARTGFATCGCGRAHWVSETGGVTGLGCLGCQGNLPAQLGIVVCPYCGQTHWVGEKKVVKFDPGVSFIPSIKVVATLFLTTLRDETPGEVATLWERVVRVHRRLTINGGNANTLREQIDAHGGKDSAPLININQLKYAVVQVDSLTEELAQMLGITQQQLFEDPPRSVVEAAKDALYFLVEAAKRLEAEWHEIAPQSGNWDTEFCLRRDKHIKADEIRKKLLAAMDLPLNWDGGA